MHCFDSKSQAQAMLSVDLHCEQEMLGKVYAVLSKRRAKVQGEVLREGTSIFYVHAFLYLVCQTLAPVFPWLLRYHGWDVSPPSNSDHLKSTIFGRGFQR